MMLDSEIINVNFGFDVEDFAERLTKVYSSNGYDVSIGYSGGAVILSLKKNARGIKKLLGLRKNTHISCRVFGDALRLSFFGAEWIWKIIAFIFGVPFLCIPTVTAVIGTIKQIKFPDKIVKDAELIVKEMQKE